MGITNQLMNLNGGEFLFGLKQNPISNDLLLVGGSDNDGHRKYL